MKRWLRHRAAALFTFALGVQLVSAWGLIGRRPAPTATMTMTTTTPPAPVTPPAVPAEPTPGEGQPLDECFVAGGELTHEGYTVRRLFKSVRVGGGCHGPDVGGESLRVSYAVLKRGGKIVARFDGPERTELNETGFGLFPLLGNDQKQLVVAQRVNRGWAYWIAELAPAFRLLYDSSDYPVIHDPRALDVDGDGVHEFVQSDRTFWFWSGHFSNADSPLTEIIFKYDSRERKYLPANHLLADYALRDIGREIEAVRRLRERSHTEDDAYRSEARSRITKIVLRYVYAGREREGWEFYEREYRLADKWEFQRLLRNALRDNAIYQRVYGDAR